MAPGDLNLKKSWNPKLVKNQKKVWEKEQDALNERKKILERQREIEQERELQKLRDNRYGDKKAATTPVRMEWMYEHGHVGDGLEKPVKNEPNDSNEEYLLGKKKLTDLIIDPKEVKKAVSGSAKMNATLGKERVVLSEKDAMKLARDDPIYKMKMMRKKMKKRVK